MHTVEQQREGLGVSAFLSTFISLIVLVVFRPGIVGSLLVLGLYSACVAVVYLIRARMSIFAYAFTGVVVSSMTWILSNTGSLDIDSVRSFLIGDSDSAVYDAAAHSISDQVSLPKQFSVWNLEYISLAEYETGYKFKDTGYVWFLGVLYTCVGSENGPAVITIINMLIMTTLIAYCASNIVVDIRNNLPLSSVLLVIAIVTANMYVLQPLTSCRKDMTLVALFFGSILLAVKRRYFFSILFGIMACTLRSGYIAVYLGGVIIYLATSRYKQRNVALLAVIAVLLAPWYMRPVLNSGFFTPTEIDASVVEAMRTMMSGSAIFLEKQYLNVVYVIFSPFPAADFRSYLTSMDSGMNAVASFINLGLFCSTVLFVVKNTYYTFSDKIWLYALYMQYMAVMWNMQQAVYYGTYGILEPRYKLIIWLIQLYFLVNNIIRNNDIKWKTEK